MCLHRPLYHLAALPVVQKKMALTKQPGSRYGSTGLVCCSSNYSRKKTVFFSRVGSTIEDCHPLCILLCSCLPGRSWYLPGSTVYLHFSSLFQPHALGSCTKEIGRHFRLPGYVSGDNALYQSWGRARDSSYLSTLISPPIPHVRLADSCYHLSESL